MRYIDGIKETKKIHYRLLIPNPYYLKRIPVFEEVNAEVALLLDKMRKQYDSEFKIKNIYWTDIKGYNTPFYIINELTLED